MELERGRLPRPHLCHKLVWAARHAKKVLPEAQWVVRPLLRSLAEVLSLTAVKGWQLLYQGLPFEEMRVGHGRHYKSMGA